MGSRKFSVWEDEGEVFVEEAGSPKVFVYGTKRRAFNALEKMFDDAYGDKPEAKELIETGVDNY